MLTIESNLLLLVWGGNNQGASPPPPEPTPSAIGPEPTKKKPWEKGSSPFSSGDPGQPVTISDSDPSMWEKIQSGDMPGVEPVFYPADHYKMTNEAAAAHGFDDKVASSIGNAARNVDYTHFSDPTSHSNRVDGHTTEQTVETNLERARETGVALSSALDAYEANPTKETAQPIIDQLGKFNHQLQDAYAHEGMSFDQHAHLDDHKDSPDANPESKAAAMAATNALFGIVTSDMRERGLDPAGLDSSRTTRLSAFPEILGQLPAMGKYLASGSKFDGVDTRWQAGTNDKLLDAFRTGLRGNRT